MKIFFPYELGERERLALTKTHGDDIEVVPYSLHEDGDPHNIISMISNSKPNFVYVPSSVHALLAAEHEHPFGVLTYCMKGLEAIHHYNPSLPKGERLERKWEWRAVKFSLMDISLN